MKPQFEVSKNLIILMLLSMICGMVFHAYLKSIEMGKLEDSFNDLKERHENLIAITDQLLSNEPELTFTDPPNPVVVINGTVEYRTPIHKKPKHKTHRNDDTLQAVFADTSLIMGVWKPIELPCIKSYHTPTDTILFNNIKFIVEYDSLNQVVGINKLPIK